jgi:hypothetical protein
VFQHENFLDVKELIKERQIIDKYEGIHSESPLIRARKRIITNLASGQQEASNSYQQPKKSQDDLTLRFDSCFESGNLFLA